MSLVIDSSITLAWLYRDERTAITESVLDQVGRLGAWVPGIWPLEVANALRQGIRRKRIDVAFRNTAIADLSDLEITIDPETNAAAWHDTLGLSDRFGLTPYDASYLELAQRRKLALASLDQDLRKAARALGLELLGL